jgi:ribonuclease D
VSPGLYSARLALCGKDLLLSVRISHLRCCLCDIVDLFHATTGIQGSENRVTIVSIYADAFENISNLEPSKHWPILYQLQPWYCKQPEFVKDLETSVLLSHGSSSLSTESKNTEESEVLDSSGSCDEVELRVPTSRGTSLNFDTAGLRREQQTTVRKSQPDQRLNPILALIDQPGDCLREGLDEIDFLELLNDSLASTPPPSSSDTCWLMVDTAEKMLQCIAEVVDGVCTDGGGNQVAASSQKITALAFDLEAYNPGKYAQLTCLLQLAADTGKEYVIDVLAPGVWELVGGLAPIFSDPAVVKIGHSIGSLDVMCLHRDFGIYIVNAFDTYEAAKALKLPNGCGLASVCSYYGLTNPSDYYLLKGQYQRQDWRTRPLSTEMIQDGRYDVRYLVKLRQLLVRDMTRGELWEVIPVQQLRESQLVADSLAATLRRYQDDDGILELPDSVSADISGEHVQPDRSDTGKASVYELRLHASLMKVISNSQYSCLRVWAGSKENHLKNATYVTALNKALKGHSLFGEQHCALYERLVHWRFRVACERKCLPAFVVPLEFLVHVSQKRPVSIQALRRIEYFLPGLLGEGLDTQEAKQMNSEARYAEEILAIVRESLRSEPINVESVESLYYFAYFQTARDDGSVNNTLSTIGTVAAVLALGAAAVYFTYIDNKRRRVR